MLRDFLSIFGHFQRHPWKGVNRNSCFCYFSLVVKELNLWHHFILVWYLLTLFQWNFSLTIQSILPKHTLDQFAYYAYKSNLRITTCLQKPSSGHNSWTEETRFSITHCNLYKPDSRHSVLWWLYSHKDENTRLYRR